MMMADDVLDLGIKLLLDCNKMFSRFVAYKKIMCF